MMSSNDEQTFFFHLIRIFLVFHQHFYYIRMCSTEKKNFLLAWFTRILIGFAHKIYFEMVIKFQRKEKWSFLFSFHQRRQSEWERKCWLILVNMNMKHIYKTGIKTDEKYSSCFFVCQQNLAPGTRGIFNRI
jgi:hypothetical protein